MLLGLNGNPNGDGTVVFAGQVRLPLLGGDEQANKMS